MRSTKRTSWTRTVSWAIMDVPPRVGCLDTRHPRRLLSPGQVLPGYYTLFMTNPRLTARLSPNCCLAKIAYRRSRRVSCSYVTFFEHPISARVGKWLPPNSDVTSLRQKTGARGYGDLSFRHSPCRISRYELPRCLVRKRFREIETLGQIASHERQAVYLPFVLHSFGSDLEAERVRKIHDQARDGVVHRAFPQTLDK